jgi:hypothetical protein
MRMRSFWSVLLSLCASPALAVGSSSQKPAVKLSWVRAESALDCLSPNALESELVERMGKNPFDGTPGQWIEGYVVRAQGHFEVALFERDENGKTIGARTFSESSESCRALDDAIELAIALIIDPNVKLAQRSFARRHASLAEATEPPRGQPPATVAQALPAPSPPRPTVPGTLVTAAPASTPSLHDAPTQATATAAGDSKLSVAGLLIGGLVPGAAPGIDMGANVGARWMALRLGMMLVPERRPNSQLGDFGFGATLLNVSGCARLKTSRLEWLNCLGMGAGAIHVTVHRPLPLEPGDRFMGFAGIESGVSLRILGPIGLDTRLFGLVPLNRWDFLLVEKEVDHSRRVFLQRRFMPGAAVGLSARFF